MTKRTKRFFILSACLLCIASSLHAAQPVPYYIPRNYTLPQMGQSGETNNTPFWQSRAVHIGFGLIASGAVVAFADNELRSMRNDFIPALRIHYDDYLQFSPAAIMLGLKAFGVEGRSSWEQMLVADAASMAVMLASVYGIKYTVSRLRPDGSSYNSFPSGHTAMAFTAATMLHLEYGDLSPWISVAGYSLATAAGVGRVLNNRHWLSDVAVGAGIGILSTKLGYLISDAIFRDRHFGRPDEIENPFLHGGNPSFISIGLGRNMPSFASSGKAAASAAGLSVGIEGAWFFAPHVGIGAEFGIDRFAARTLRSECTIDDRDPLNSLSLLGGVHLSWRLATRWHAGGKLVAGTLKNSSTERTDINSGATVHFDDRWRFAAAGGGSLRFMAARNLGIRLFADLNMVPTSYSVGSASASVVYSFPLTLGVAVDALLW